MAPFDVTRVVKKCLDLKINKKIFCHVENSLYFCREFLTQFNYGQREMEMAYQVGNCNPFGYPRCTG